jgi:hypothetical protein
VKVTLDPSLIVWLAGWVVMEGATGPPLLITTVKPVMLRELMAPLPPLTKIPNSLKDVGAPAEVSVAVWV